MKKLLLYILLIITVIVAFLVWRTYNKRPRVEVTHSMMVMRIEEMGKLEVVKYNIQNIVEYTKNRTWLPNAKAIMITIGEVVGCIDLKKVSAQDVSIIKDSIHIVLPVPEICYCKIDHSQSRVYNTSYGFWETATLVDEAYRYAEAQLYVEARRMGIEADCKRNAQKVLVPLFGAFGYKKVGISFKETERQTIPNPLFKNLE